MSDIMIRVLLEGDAGSRGFIAQTFNNIAEFVKSLGSYVVLIAGIALIIAAAVHTVRAFIARGVVKWSVIAVCLLVGGMLTFGGWKLISGGIIGGLGKSTLDTLNEGNTPTAIGEFNDSGSGNSCLDKARSGLGILASEFIVPFGTAAAVCVGVALVALAIIQIAKFFVAGGRGQVSWLKIAAMCVIGSVLFAATPTENSGGWTWVRDMIVSGTKDTIIKVSDGEANGEAKEPDSKTLDEYSEEHTGADPADVPS